MGTRLQYSSARLRELVSHSIPHSITVIKSLCLLRRPRYVHRGSRRMFIYSDSAIPSITSVFRPAALPRHHNKIHVRTRYLRPLVCVDSQAPPTQPMSAASFMLLNAQSINNKPGLIHDIITERHIDICCIVETWQKPQEFMALNKATPPGYAYIQNPRLKGGGGGLAVIYRADILTKEVAVTTATSFECIVFTLAGFSQLQFVLVYRPPKNTSSDWSAFLSELSELLTPVCAMSPSTYLLGDMNVHVDSTSCAFTYEFMSVLEWFNFSQHVRGPTHNKGHTLDLVCSTGTPPIDLQCLDLAISDHHAIAFSVPASRPGQRPKRTITYRNIKAVSPPALSTMIAAHLAGISPDPSDCDLVSSYNTALALSLDSLAPIKTLTYYSTLIGSQENHPRKLFSTVNKLLSPLPPIPASGNSDLCHRFLNFFQDKVDTIHQQLQTSTTCLHTPQLQDTAPSATCAPFTSFTPVDESLTTELVTKAKASSCSLDPMPTTLVKSQILTSPSPYLTPLSLNAKPHPQHHKSQPSGLLSLLHPEQEQH
ncbi:uncharacterized protein LOC121511739%2C partial [Xyrichtys novacula]|uniref:Uncharacterized protein LOC121511739, partial n=1 Tax=Xyrichtys novacula TaxID=13765 RepID=A0AAV1G4C7_XYRNO|nr:uncharacterized protein LOC121511739%2C partial [Xyrichtys novacula]